LDVISFFGLVERTRAKTIGGEEEEKVISSKSKIKREYKTVDTLVVVAIENNESRIEQKSEY
jgi:hypothetical protein